MRVKRSNSVAATATLVAWLLPLVSGISVPTGKLTPITPARPTPRTVNPHAPANPAPVVEYSQDNPEPPPLDPSYVAPTYNYFDTLARHHIYYVPVRYRNFNAISNNVEYEPPQKYFGHTLGKNIGFKPYKQQLNLPYFPPRPVDWARPYSNDVNSQYINEVDSQYNNQASNQYSQVNSQYNNRANNQYNNQANNQVNAQYNNLANNQANTQYNVQPTPQQQQQQQQQQYEAVSTQTAPASTTSPATPAAPAFPKVDYTTGKGSYDVTGKGGSKSEYYSKDDWSKKTAYPKKVLGQGLTPRKFASHKY